MHLILMQRIQGSTRMHYINLLLLTLLTYLHLNININIIFLYCADPDCKTEGALYDHYITYYSEQYVRLKRNVFSPQREGRQAYHQLSDANTSNRLSSFYFFVC